MEGNILMALGFAAGVMIYVGFVDLFCSSRLVLGFGYANIFFLLGLLLIYLLDHLMKLCVERSLTWGRSPGCQTSLA